MKLLRKSNEEAGRMNCFEKIELATPHDIYRGLLLLEYLKWESEDSALADYDKENKCIVVAEHKLMHLIEIANPGQPTRDIRLKRFCDFD